MPPTMPTRPLWRDGALAPWDEASASVLSHAMQRGSLVFDVGAMRETISGGVALFRPKEHIARFLRSGRLVGLDVTWSGDELLDATLQVARASGLSSALVRWSAFLPDLEPDVLPRSTSRASVVIAIISAADAYSSAELVPARAEAVRVAISRDMRKAGPEVFPPQAKVAASYLGPMLAKRRARADGFDEVVLLDREGLVAEAPTSNVFAVTGGVVVTPPTERVLDGITRASVLEWARAEGIAVREAPLQPGELSGADEAFFTATSLPVLAMASIDGRVLPAGAPGPVTARVWEAMVACERGADPRWARWLVQVR